MLPFSTKITYGVAGIGDAIMYNLTGTFLVFFLNTVVGMSPVLSGAVAAVGSIWETLWGGMMGYISDNTRTGMGRRKPYILLGAFPMALFTSLVFTAIDVPDALRFFYYSLMLVCYWTCFMTFFVPYLAWGADLTDDYNERTVLRGYTFIFDAFGAAISMVFPTVLVDLMVSHGAGTRTSWVAAGFFCGLISALTILFMGLNIKDKDQKSWEKENGRKATVSDTVRALFSQGRGKGKSNEDGGPEGKGAIHAMVEMVINFADILRLPASRYIMLASTFCLVSYAVFTADRVYYLNYNMDLSSGQITVLLVYMSLLTILYVPLLNILCAMFDKRHVYIYGLLISAGILAYMGFSGVDTFRMMLLAGAVFNIANSCYWHLIPSMIYDVCEADELASGKKRGGIVVSLQSLSESMGNAIGLQGLGIVLSLGGFDEEASSQSAETLKLINTAMFVIPAVFMVLSAVMIYKYPITRERYARILKELGRKQNP